jgi:hypothetical protein
MMRRGRLKINAICRTDSNYILCKPKHKYTTGGLMRMRCQLQKYHDAGFPVISWRPRHKEWYSLDNFSLFNLATVYGCHTIWHGPLNTCAGAAQQNELRITKGFCCSDQISGLIFNNKREYRKTGQTDGRSRGQKCDALSQNRRHSYIRYILYAFILLSDSEIATYVSMHKAHVFYESSIYRYRMDFLTYSSKTFG